MLDVELFGLKPAGHHLHNLLLHCLNTSLLFLLLRRFTASLVKSFLVAALFAVHPLHVESVAWVAERKDMLSTFFGLLSLIAYGYYAGRSPSSILHPPSSSFSFLRSPAYWLTGLFLALGLMSKPMLVTWPFVMLLLDLWPFRRVELSTFHFPLSTFKRLVLEKLPFFVLAAASCLITMRAQGTGRSVVSLEWLPLEVRIGNSLAAVFDYLARTFVPTKLAVFYPFPTEIPWEKAFLAAVIFVVLFGWAIRCLKTQPALFVGLAWFVGTLIPVIGLVQVGMQASADRYAYIPHIGLFIALIWGLFHMLSYVPRSREMIGIGCALALGGCWLLTVQQVKVWQSDLTLFKHAKNVTQRNYIALTIYGKQLADQGNNAEALSCYQQAIEIQPRYASGYYVMAEVYRNTGRTNEALAKYGEAIQLDPNHAESLNSRGALYVNLNRAEEAKRDFLKSIEVLPSFSIPRLNLGIVLQAEKRHAEAAEALNAYLDLEPDSTRALTLLGDVYFRLADFPRAITNYERALRLDNKLVTARFGLASAYVSLQRFQAAVPLLESLVATEPKIADAHYQLGLAYCALNRAPQGISSFRKAVELKPGEPFFHYHLATALSQGGRKAEAVQSYDEALRLRYEFPEALNNLAWMLAADADPAIRDGKRAVELAQKACQLTQDKEPLLIGTLAAAYAEAGRFEEAVATAHRASEQAKAAGQNDLAQRNQELAELYRTRKPYHEPAK